MNQKKYYPTAVALYITYFILGIAVTIMGQYKQSFAAMWGANQLADGSFDVSKVMAIIAAVGLGRLIAFPFAGPFSDKYGRRLSALVGVVFFAIFFIGITFTHSTVLAYILPHTVFPGGRHHHRRWYLFGNSALPSQGGGTQGGRRHSGKEKNEADTLRNFTGLHRLYRIHNLHAVYELQSGAGQALWHGKSLYDSVLLFRGHYLRSPSDSGTDEKGSEAHPRSGYLSLCCVLRTAADVFCADSADLHGGRLLNRLFCGRRRIAAGNLYGK